MARIRTIKPEFWEDERVAELSPRARLLFIASWNFADDEGLVRWTADYLKASAFMYDQLTPKQMTALMSEIETSGLVFPYCGGKAQQRLAYIVHFLKHQRINKPQPSKLPPPSVQSPDVRAMYAERDGWRCQICGGDINHVPSIDERLNLSLDHVKPRAAGGTDYPSNIQAAHLTCNKAKKDKFEAEVPPHSGNGSRNGSVNPSPPEGKGSGREVEQGSGRERASSPAVSSSSRVGPNRDDDDGTQQRTLDDAFELLARRLLEQRNAELVDRGRADQVIPLDKPARVRAWIAETASGERGHFETVARAYLADNPEMTADDLAAALAPELVLGAVEESFA